MDFEYDQRRSVLSVNLGHASGLVFPPDNITSMGVARNLFIHARVQLLPSTNTSRINTSLFSLNPPKPSVYRRLSQLHRETACPVFREVCFSHQVCGSIPVQAFEFEMDELKEHIPNLRLYIAIMASLPISKDGSGFLGCMSFSIADLVSQSTESLPKLFWLLNKTQGISRYVPVEHAILDGDSLDATMEISGRKTTLSNSWVRRTTLAAAV